MKTLPAIDRTTAGQDVTVRLRQAIITGEIAAGTQLREVSLARDLGVGRAPVREALRQLMQEGLVIHEPHRGSMVVILTEEDVLDIYLAREGIEPLAVQLIVERADPSAHAPIEQAMENMRRARGGPKPTREVVEADVALHEAVVLAAGSPRLHRMFRTLAAEMRMYLLLAHPPYDPETWVSDHVQLTESILAGSADAPEMMRRHLRESRAIFLDGMTAAGP